MQATVALFRPDQSGSVILDNGTVLPFAATAFAHSGLRFLRAGQRVAIRVSAGQVTALTLSTFALSIDITDDKKH